jgi:hypothetical protein
MGMLLVWAFAEDFIGFWAMRSSILGIVGLCVMRQQLRFWLIRGYLLEESQFGT